MTETQAMSEAGGASAKPGEQEAAEGGTPATGRAAVGRATVPADGSSPKFTRAAGMAPPPEEPAAAQASGPPAPSGGPSSAPPSGPPHQAGAPVSVAKKGPSSGSPPPSSAPPAQAVAVPAASAVGRVGVPVVGPGSGAAAATGRIGMPGPVPGRGGSGTGVLGGAPAGAAPGGATPGNPAPGGQGARAGAPATGTGRPGAAAVGAARVTSAVRAARSGVSAAAARGPRRARLNVKRIDPWSVMKFSFAVSLVLFIVAIVATSVLYLALDAMGVFETVNSTLSDMVGATGGESAGSGFKITAKGVIGTSALIGAVNVVLFTALATLGAFIYNVCADLVGGIELTLAERD